MQKQKWALTYACMYVHRIQEQDGDNNTIITVTMTMMAADVKPSGFLMLASDGMANYMGRKWQKKFISHRQIFTLLY